MDLLEERTLGEELRLRAAREDAAVLEYRDLVCQRDRREPMGDDDRRPAAHHLAQAGTNPRLRGRVHRRRGVIENEDARVDEERAGDGDALPLSPGQRDSALTDHGLVAVGQVFDDEVMGLRGARRGLDRLVRSVG